MDTVGFLGLGIIHEEQGIPCQDALAAHRTEDGTRILVLSDGAGSAAYAAQAARANVRGVLDCFEAYTLQQFMQLPEAEQTALILASCRKRLAEISGDFASIPWEFSATLLFFVYDGARWLAGHLGDGFLTVLDRESQPLVSSDPENKENDRQTYFTVSSDAASHLRFYRGAGLVPSQVLMVSDGPCSMFHTRHRTLQGAAGELLGYIRNGEITSEDTLADVLDQMNYYAFDRRDDWSVLIWSDGADFGPWTAPAVRSMLEQEKNKQRN